MKKFKKLIPLLLFLPFLMRGDFLDELQSMDILLQQGKFQEALDKGRALQKTNISDEDKKALQNLLSKIEEKIKSEAKKEISNSDVVNNNGEPNFETDEVVEDENLETISDGTVAYPGDELNDISKYKEYDRLEAEVLASKNQDNINSLLKIYMRSGLYERAMKLGQKSRDSRNMYIGALAARLTGRYDISITQYKRVINSEPDNLDAILGLGLAYRANKDNSNASKYLRMYIEKGGRNSNVNAVLQEL